MSEPFLGGEPMVRAELVLRVAEGRANVVDLIEVMAADPSLVERVTRRPEALQKAFQLSDRAVEAMKGLRVDDFADLGRELIDSRSFALGAAAAGKVTQPELGLAAGDTCYYIG